MKKKIFILITILMTLSLCFNLSVIYSGYVYAHGYYEYIKPNNTPGFHELNDEYNLYAENTLITDQEKRFTKKALEYIKSAPLYQNDYYIILTANVENEEDMETDYAGVTNLFRKTIYVEYGSIDHAMLHELGHAVDNTYNFSNTAEFQSLYNSVEHDDYYTSTAQEYFARNYELYVKNQIENQDLKDYYKKILMVDFEDEKDSNQESKPNNLGNYISF